MSEALPEYKIYALRYATRESRRGDNFVGGDPKHDAPMTMDYYLWAAVSPERTFVIDTGFAPGSTAANRRGRKILTDPIALLKRIGVDAETVEDVIMTHMHSDHAGNIDRFPKARFHIQEAEVRFVTGPHMRHHVTSHSFILDDILNLVRLNYAGRVRHYNGDAELAPGLSIHPCPGHTVGLQFVRVHTKRGFVVLASDVAHFYENLESKRPYRGLVSLPDAMDSAERVEALAPSCDHIVPGHDPLVMRRYRPPSAGLEGIVVRLDEPPLRQDA